MKLLIYGVNYYPELTGIGKYSGEMAEWLSQTGHDVHVVTAPPYYPEWKVTEGYSSMWYRRENLNGVDIWRCPIYVPARPSGLRRILHLVSFAMSSLPVMLRNVFWKPDMIMVVEPPLFCAPAAWLAARLSGANCWLHVQDFEVDAAFDLGIIRLAWMKGFVSTMERWLMRRFDVVSTISNSMLKRLYQKGVSDPILLPNWVDTTQIYPLEKHSPFREKYNLDKETVIALYSGNMGEKQGLEIIIEVARELQERTQIQFVMCGSGAALKRLRKLADDLNNILWLPLQPLERLNDLLNLADIHLLPQRENVADLVMPSKLTGMLASGRPVVATALSGTQLAEVVEGRGIVTSPGNMSEFSAAINELVNTPDKRIKFGQCARQYAMENLDRDAVMLNFESELLAVVKK